MAKQWDLSVLGEPIRFMWERIEANNGRGGNQMDKIEEIIKEHILETCSGRNVEVFTGKNATLPGYYRTRKNWDVIVIIDGFLAAAVEVKSQRVGRPKLGGLPQVAKNVNNRIEEAIGSANDIRCLADGRTAAAWLGYLFVLEKAPETIDPAPKDVEAKLPVDAIFGLNPSIARRYQVMCQRLVESNLYDGACLLLSPLSTFSVPTVEEPDIQGINVNADISFDGFMRSLQSHLDNFS